MYVSLASALPRYVEGSKVGQPNAISGKRVPFGPKRADDHHMKPPNGSMSKEAESPVERAPHRDQGVTGQGLVDKFSLITTSSCRAGTSSEVAR